MQNESLEEKIRNLKDKIADAKDYLNSDFCNRCVRVYQDIVFWEQEIKDLENDERN